jgi:hypothetical protein
MPRFRRGRPGVQIEVIQFGVEELELDVDRRAYAQRTINPDLPLVRFYDVLADR